MPKPAKKRAAQPPDDQLLLEPALIALRKVLAACDCPQEQAVDLPKNESTGDLEEATPVHLSGAGASPKGG